jgi:hypothetical protein
MNQGLKGSSAVKLAIQAPPMPSVNSTSGPTQHTDAPTAANALASSEPLALNVAIHRVNLFDGDKSRVRTMVRSQGVR